MNRNHFKMISKCLRMIGTKFEFQVLKQLKIGEVPLSDLIVSLQATRLRVICHVEWKETLQYLYN